MGAQRSVDQEDLCVCFYFRIANPRGDELESPAEKGVIWKSERDAGKERAERERACSSEQRTRMHERDRRRRSRQQRIMPRSFMEADDMFKFHSSWHQPNRVHHMDPLNASRLLHLRGPPTACTTSLHVHHLHRPRPIAPTWKWVDSEKGEQSESQPSRITAEDTQSTSSSREKTRLGGMMRSRPDTGAVGRHSLMCKSCNATVVASEHDASCVVRSYSTQDLPKSIRSFWATAWLLCPPLPPLSAPGPRTCIR